MSNTDERQVSKHASKISELNLVTHVLQQRLSEFSQREAAVLEFVEKHLDADTFLAFTKCWSHLDISTHEANLPQHDSNALLGKKTIKSFSNVM